MKWITFWAWVEIRYLFFAIYKIKLIKPLICIICVDHVFLVRMYNIYVEYPIFEIIWTRLLLLVLNHLKQNKYYIIIIWRLWQIHLYLLNNQHWHHWFRRILAFTTNKSFHQLWNIWNTQGYMSELLNGFHLSSIKPNNHPYLSRTEKCLHQ